MSPPDEPEAPTPVPCSACRGTGRIISNLGGTPHEIPCPWCDGGGRRLPPAHDAQAGGGVEAGGRGPGDDDGGGPDLAA
jgi:DnaJ-class molecular chaperone